MALEARAGLKTLSLLSRGAPVLVQAGVGALGLGLRYLGRLDRGDWGYSVRGLGYMGSGGLGSREQVAGGSRRSQFNGSVLGVPR